MEKTILTTIPAEKQKDYPLAEEFIDIYELALANDFDKVMEQDEINLVKTDLTKEQVENLLRAAEGNAARQDG